MSLAIRSVVPARRVGGLIPAALMAALLLVPGSGRAGEQPECAILLHGLARTAGSMEPMAEFLREAGMTAVNVDYPSRHHPIEVLAPRAIGEGLAGCAGLPGARVHFVTHSLGGILVRQYLATQDIDGLGRVVMLAPPNHGSETVDALRDTPGFEALNGPAGMQLGTDASSVPLALGPAHFEVGIITGDRSINLILSSYLPDPDDGKVSVASARLEGMRDFLVVHHAHPFIMRSDRVMRQTLHFLREGRFDPGDTGLE